MEDRRKNPRMIHSDENNNYLEFIINDQTMHGKIYDYSKYGFGIILSNVDLARLDIPVYVEKFILHAYGDTRELGPGRIVRISILKNESNLLGIYLEKEFIDMDKFVNNNLIHLQEDEIKKIRLQLSQVDAIRPEFLQFTSTFINGLSLYKITLDKLDAKFLQEHEELQNVLLNSVLTGIGQEFYNYLTQKIEELKEVTAKYTRYENEKHGFFLRKTIWNYILESEFIARTNIKPRGYAGDSTMMEMLYQNSYRGTSSFGKIFHKHPCDTKAADAVRNRRKLIIDYIEDGLKNNQNKTYKILSVACGPAWEIQDFVRSSENCNNVEIYLMDQDENALAEAKKGLQSIKGFEKFKIYFIQESVRTILKSSHPELQKNRFDFIYSMGLYDYLTEPIAKVLTEKIFQMLFPGGKIVLGNYHVKNETRKYMEYIMDWVLYYRDEESFIDVIENIRDSLSHRIEFDDSDTQMFLHIIKNQHQNPT